MRKILILPILLMTMAANAADIDAALRDTRAKCSYRLRPQDIKDLKTAIGISTAVGAVGTVAAGVGLGTGIAQTGATEEAPAKTTADIFYTDGSVLQFDVQPLETGGNREQNLETAQGGGLIVGAAANALGVFTALSGHSLSHDVSVCLASVKELGDAYMQARMDNPNDPRLAHAERVINACGRWEYIDMAQVDKLANRAALGSGVAAADKIISACGKWEYVDIDKINKKAKGSMITSGVGATVGAAGTIASVMANSKKPTDDNAGKLNTTANVMAGGATVASGVATVLNATQIKTIKNAVEVADNCEEALQ